MSLYGLVIGISVVICFSYFSRHNHLVPKSHENIFTLGTILSALIGARTYHVLDHWSYYSQNLIQILNTRAGGLGIFGALLGALLFIYFYSLLYRLSFIGLLDLITPILPLAQSIGRLGNFVNHEIPFWWFEAILNIALFLIIKKLNKNNFAVYLIGYGTIRLLFELLRSDTWVIGSIKIAQVISIIFIASGALLCRRKNSQPPPSSP